MAGLEFFTGFEGCGNSAEARSLFDEGNVDIIYSSTGGYANGKCIRMSSTKYAGKFRSVPTDTICAGFHGRDVFSSIYSQSPVLYFASDTGSEHIQIHKIATGFEVRCGTTSSYSVIASCITNLMTSDIHHIEVKLYVHPTVGYVKVKLDGQLIMDAVNLNTGSGLITKVRIYSNPPYASSAYFDNIFIADDWQGELRSVLLTPIADVSTGFTPLSGTDNYTMVDDVPSDGDTSYVSGADVGMTDLYDFTAFSTDKAVKGVTIITRAKKDEVGERVLDIVSVQDGVERSHASTALITEYPSFSHNGIATLGNCPDGTPWTVAKLNDIAWGVKVTT